MKNITSEQFKFVYEDLKKSLKNACIFGAPLLLIILTELQAGKGFEDIKLLVVAWLLQTGIDLTKKFVSIKKYSIKK